MSRADLPIPHDGDLGSPIDPAGDESGAPAVAVEIVPDAADTPKPLEPAGVTRLLEAVLFASPEPLTEAALRAHLPEAADVAAALAELAALYRGRGVVLERVARGWAFRTAPDLAARLRALRSPVRKLSRAAVETLAIIAYHQPVTRAEIEAIRGVGAGKGTFDVLVEAGWIKPGRRRDSPGRPLTWVTSPAFLDHFCLDSLNDLPGVTDLRAAGLLDSGPDGTPPTAAVLPGGRVADSTVPTGPGNGGTSNPGR